MTTTTESGATLLERLEDGLKATNTGTAGSMTSSASSPLTTASEVDGSELEDNLSSFKKVKLDAIALSDQSLVVTESTGIGKDKSSSTSTSNNIFQIFNPEFSQVKSKIPPCDVTAPKTTTTTTTTAKLSYFKTDANLKPLISPTKPLVINHSSSLPSTITVATTSTRAQPSDNSSTISIIPTLATQLIFSSIISTQAKSTATTTTTTTAVNSKAPGAAAAVATLQRTALSGTHNRNLVSPISTNVVVGGRPCGIATTSATSSSGQLMLTNSTAAASQAGANGQVSARLMDMGKRLLEAAREGNTDHVRQLVINSGAPFTSDWLGTTALHLASQHGHTEIAEILLRGGVNRDARTKLERTALHLAAQGGWHEVVDLLLIHGSDVNVRDMLKMTPLHWAVERGHLVVVEKLLFNGADVHARSKFQLTPIDIAQRSQSYEMMELFKNWTHRGDNLGIYNELENNFCESHALLDDAEADYSTPQPPPPSSHHNHLSDLHDHNHHQLLQHHHHNHLPHLSSNQMVASNAAASTSRAPISDINEPFIDLVELEWNALKLEPDFFLSNDEESEPKVEYLMKVVEELQKENRQLRQRVEQLSTSP